MGIETEDLIITAAGVLLEAARVAFADPAKLAAADGSPIPVRELDEGTRAAVSAVGLIDRADGSRVMVATELHEKGRALDCLCRVLEAKDRDHLLAVRARLLAVLEAAAAEERQALH